MRLLIRTLPLLLLLPLILGLRPPSINPFEPSDVHPVTQIRFEMRHQAMINNVERAIQQGTAKRIAAAKTARWQARADVYIAEQERIAEEVRKREEELAAQEKAAEAARKAEQERAQDEAQVQTTPAPVAPAITNGSVWDRLAECESNGEWDYGPHSGWGSGIYHGGLQFHPGTWSSFAPAGYPTYAYQASREQQIAVAEKVKAAQGWQAWPACSKQLGLR